MTLPTCDKTWAFSVNETVGNLTNYDSDGKDFFYKLKQRLKTMGWVVDGSCDGTNVSNSGTTDHIGSSSEVIFRAIESASYACSWIVLKNGSQYLLMYATSLNGSGAFIYMYFSTTGYGATHSGVDGTAYVLPTSASATAWDLIVSGSMQPSGAAFQGKLHVAMTSDGDCTRIFFTDSSTNPANIGYLFIETAKAPVTEWTTPIFTMASNWSANTLNATTYSAGSSNTKSKIGGTALTLRLTGEGVHTTGILTDWLAATDDASSSWPMMPIGIACSTTSHRNWRKGLVYDMWWGSSNVSTGDTYPTTVGEKRQFIQMGRMIFPWDGLVTPDGTAIDLG